MVGRVSAFAIYFSIVASSVMVLLTGALLGIASPGDLGWFLEPAATPTSTGIALILLAGALVAAFTAGYAAAALAPTAELVNAFAAGMLILVFNALGFRQLGLADLPLWCSVGALVASLPSSLAGGYLQRGPAAA
jgi:HAMP domain-containing protein